MVIDHIENYKSLYERAWKHYTIPVSLSYDMKSFATLYTIFFSLLVPED